MGRTDFIIDLVNDIIAAWCAANLARKLAYEETLAKMIAIMRQGGCSSPDWGTHKKTKDEWPEEMKKANGWIAQNAWPPAEAFRHRLIQQAFAFEKVKNIPVHWRKHWVHSDKESTGRSSRAAADGNFVPLTEGYKRLSERLLGEMTLEQALAAEYMLPMPDLEMLQRAHPPNLTERRELCERLLAKSLEMQRMHQLLVEGDKNSASLRGQVAALNQKVAELEAALKDRGGRLSTIGCGRHPRPASGDGPLLWPRSQTTTADKKSGSRSRRHHQDEEEEEELAQQGGNMKVVRRQAPLLPTIKTVLHQHPAGAFAPLAFTAAQVRQAVNLAPTAIIPAGTSGTVGDDDTGGAKISSSQMSQEEEMNDGIFKLADFVNEFEALALRQSLDFRVENDVFTLMLRSEMDDQWFSRLLMLRDEHSTIRLAEFTGCQEEFNEKVEYWIKTDYAGPEQLMEAMNIKCIEYFQQS